MRDSSHIPEIEKKIYEKINFSNKFLTIRSNFIKIDKNFYIKLNDVKKFFKGLGLTYEYNGENSHQIYFREYNDYTFSINFIIKGDYTDVRLYILKNTVLIAPKETSIYYLLNFIPFDNKLLNPNFGFNSITDVKNYILDIINLCNEFAEEYIKEIEAGNVS